MTEIIKLKELVQTQKIIEGQIEFQKLELNQTKEAIADIIEKPIKQARLQQGKDTGVINLEVENVEVKHDLPKKVVWDQNKLRKIRAKILLTGDVPDNYMDAKFSVSEKEYKKFLPVIQAVFTPAREVKTGKAKITFKIEKEN